jgi:D-psicose/D-tagatose/L-ribulose 3-epimerase
MTFGINTFLFTSPFTNSSTRLFKRFKAWGFDAVEIAVEDPSHIDPIQVRRQLDRHGLVCCSVCACMGPDRDLRGTRRQQRTAITYLNRLLDQAVVLGASSLIGPVFSTTGRAQRVPARESAAQWRTVTTHLKTLCRTAAEHDVMICLEPLNRFETDFINTCEQALEMIHRVDSPALKILLDTFHMNIEEKNPARAIRKAGRHLGHVHVSGSDRGTPGNDHTDWPSIARALNTIRYTGPVVIESFTPEVEVIARAAAIWRRIEPTRDAIAVDGIRFLKNLLKP